MAMHGAALFIQSELHIQILPLVFGVLVSSNKFVIAGKNFTISAHRTIASLTWKRKFSVLVVFASYSSVVTK